MRITTQAEYGLLCVLHLARRVPGTAVSVREIAAVEGLPAQYCEKIFRQLRQADLVESVRGATGGFRLAREAAAISLRDVIEATEGPTFELNCSDHPVTAERCLGTHACSLRPVWIALQARIESFLGGLTIADLLLDEVDVRARLSSATPLPAASTAGPDEAVEPRANVHAMG